MKQVRILEWRVKPLVKDAFTRKPCKPATTCPSDLAWTVLRKPGNERLWAFGARCADGQDKDQHFEFRWREKK